MAWSTTTHLPSRVAAEKAAALKGAAPVDPRAHVASVGVLGATPLDLLSLNGAELIRQRVETKQTQQNLLHMRLRTGEITSPFRHVVQKTYEDNKPDVYVFGMDCGFDQLGHLFTVDRNVVVSPAGLKPAKYLEQKYGIPYEVSYPIGHELAVSLHRRVCEAAQPADAEPAARSAKVLILHQQVAGNSLRESLESINDANRTLNALDAMGPTSMLEESGKGVPGTEDIPRPEPEVHPEAELSISVGTFRRRPEVHRRGRVPRLPEGGAVRRHPGRPHVPHGPQVVGRHVPPAAPVFCQRRST